MHTYNLGGDFFDNVFILQVMEEVGGRGAGQQTELGDVGWLVGCTGDAQSEEFDALVLGIGNSRKNVRVSWVGNAISEQQGHLNAARAGFLQINPGHVGDCVSSVGAVPDVDDGSDTSLEVVYAPPVFECLLCDNMTAVLQQSHPEAQAATSLQLRILKSFHQVHSKLLFLFMIVLGTLRAVQQERELQAAVLI